MRAELTMQGIYFASSPLQGGLKMKRGKHVRLADRTFPKAMHIPNQMAHVRLADHAALREGVALRSVIFYESPVNLKE
jgi:hypothetical protein